MQQLQDNPNAIQKAPELRPVKPAVDIFESEEAFLIVVDVPGTAETDVKLMVEKDELVLEAPVSARERHRYAYVRKFALPDGVSRDQITAEHKAGVLSLRLPKAGELRPRRIQVRAA